MKTLSLYILNVITLITLCTYKFNVGKDIEDNIVVSNYVNEIWENLNLNCHSKNSLFFTHIERDETEKYIIKIKDHSSYYENGITNYIIKKTLSNMSEPLMIIFNLLSMGVFPSSFKKCVVIPIFKVSDKSYCSNYRPYHCL